MSGLAYAIQTYTAYLSQNGGEAKASNWFHLKTAVWSTYKTTTIYNQIYQMGLFGIQIFQLMSGLAYAIQTYTAYLSRNGGEAQASIRPIHIVRNGRLIRTWAGEAWASIQTIHRDGNGLPIRSRREEAQASIQTIHKVGNSLLIRSRREEAQASIQTIHKVGNSPLIRSRREKLMLHYSQSTESGIICLSEHWRGSVSFYTVHPRSRE